MGKKSSYTITFSLVVTVAVRLKVIVYDPHITYEVVYNVSSWSIPLTLLLLLGLLILIPWIVKLAAAQHFKIAR